MYSRVHLSVLLYPTRSFKHHHHVRGLFVSFVPDYKTLAWVLRETKAWVSFMLTAEGMVPPSIAKSFVVLAFPTHGRLVRARCIQPLDLDEPGCSLTCLAISDDPLPGRPASSVQSTYPDPIMAAIFAIMPILSKSPITPCTPI